MCGIAGIWARTGGQADDLAGSVVAMTDAISHRGPDDSGYWLDKQYSVALGQRRLSIIDLSPAGHQPMISSNGRFVVTFNGEIYNFRELRKELEARGAHFRGHSDTEVIVEGCVHFGISETIKKLNGMFAIAFWDNREKKLYLARDRMGEKPLYYGVFGPLIIFGSELKALRAHAGWTPELNRNAIAGFLRHNYIPGPFSIYQNVRKLPPAGLAVIDQSGPVREHLYWDMQKVVAAGAANPLPADEEEAVESLDTLLRDAVGRRMISDVPLGAFLSGGYDSSIVAALMQENSSRPVKTFTIGFEDPAFNESNYAEAIAGHLGTDHTTFSVTGADAIKAVPLLADMYDEPFADSSQIPTHLISALTRQHVTVALSGDGGDELFTGYNRYQWAETVWKPFAWAPRGARTVAASAIRCVPRHIYDRLAGVIPGAKMLRHVGYKAHRVADLLAVPSIDAVYRRLVSHTETPGSLVPGTTEARSPIWERDLSALLPDPIDRMRFLDMQTYLPDDILTKVDRASMAVALEVRVPLLDHRIVEWVWRLPRELNARANRPKHLLRRVLAKYVPARLTDRPKMGFGVPLGEWLRNPLRDWAEDLLSAQSLKDDGVFNVEPIRRAWAEHLAGSDQHHYMLWNILMFQAWNRKWAVGGGAVHRVEC